MRRAPLFAAGQRPVLQKLRRAPGAALRLRGRLLGGLGVEEAALELGRGQLGGQARRGLVGVMEAGALLDLRAVERRDLRGLLGAGTAGGGVGGRGRLLSTSDAPDRRARIRRGQARYAPYGQRVYKGRNSFPHNEADKKITARIFLRVSL